jgi:hypothetical protein
LTCCDGNLRRTLRWLAPGHVALRDSRDGG